MSFGWLDNLELARNLHRSGDPPEAGYRGAISRAYYAVHHVIRDYAEEAHQASFDRSRIHTEVVDFYVAYPNNTPEIQAITKAISDEIEDLRKMRVDADYYNPLKMGEPSMQAYKAICNADRIVTLLDDLRNAEGEKTS